MIEHIILKHLPTDLAQEVLEYHDVMFMIFFNLRRQNVKFTRKLCVQQVRVGKSTETLITPL